MIKYYYPGYQHCWKPSPDTLECYAGIGWKFITLKYKHGFRMTSWLGDQDGPKARTTGVAVTSTCRPTTIWAMAGGKRPISATIKNYSDATPTGSWV